MCTYYFFKIEFKKFFSIRCPQTVVKSEDSGILSRTEDRDNLLDYPSCRFQRNLMAAEFLSPLFKYQLQNIKYQFRSNRESTCSVCRP